MTNTTQTINKVPLLDLQAQYAPLDEGIKDAFEKVYASKQFIMGPQVAELENEISAYCGTSHSVGVSSGTDALVLALMGLGIQPGDEIITTPFTFFATVGSIYRLGAVPVFVDIEPDTFLIDVSAIKEKITAKTKAIIPVHLFGQMADMDSILDIASEHNLFVIEDAAQAIGSSYVNRDGKTIKAGAAGDVGCFSFFPSKNLGCLGDGGIITTQNAELAERMKQLRVHGAKEKYYHGLIGGNFRLDTLQAAFLLVKLPLLEEQHQQREENAKRYNAELEGVVGLPVAKDNYRMIYNQYTIRSSNRDALQAHLQSKNIGCAVYYPVPLHLQDCFDYLGYKEGDFPHSEQAAKEVLSIPIYSELNDAQQDYVIDAIKSFNG